MHYSPGEIDLPNAARLLVGAAEEWWTVAYTVPTRRLRKMADGYDDDGLPLCHMEYVDETNLVVRGWRGEGAFMAVWSSGKADCAYWWTRQHEAWADLPRELVKWETPRPAPVKIPFAELKRRLKSKV